MFKEFTKKVREKFQFILDNHEVLFLTDVERDSIWEMYLDSFPDGTNNIYIERGEYDCNICKQFLRPYGNVVAIDSNNNLISIWDVEVEGYYQDVANSLSEFVKSKPIKNLFVSKLSQLGTDKNVQLLSDSTTKTWHHLSFKLPTNRIDNSSKSEESIMGSFRDSRNVFKRSLDEISLDSIETVLDLIDQNSIYRGEEHRATVESFLNYKRKYLLVSSEEQSNYCWKETSNARVVTKIKNSAIGTLLSDISSDKGLDRSVSEFEKIMAPNNYKRPKALVTKKMIESANKRAEELGIIDSLGRRNSSMEDITINNVIFANRDAKKSMSNNVFDDLIDDIKVNPKHLDKIEEIKIEDFISNVIPKITSMEVMLENKHTSNLLTLISPINSDAKSITKWNNNITWSYNGNVADSMKEKVKRSGGKVDGVLRFSIEWKGRSNNDLDAHCIEPGGNEIFYSNLVNYETEGNLDVDIIDPNDHKDVVENITWPLESSMEEGIYKFFVNNYTNRGNTDEGFSAEIEFNGEIHTFEYSKPLRHKEDVYVAEVSYSKLKGFKILKSLDSSLASKEVWNIKTNNFQKVSTLMYSPNYWDDQKGIGNKHYFFMLENCKNEYPPRGFYNEFLNQELMEDKRVFELLGSKMKVQENPNGELSGIGFSSTQRNSIIVKVEGSFNRTLKVNF